MKHFPPQKIVHLAVVIHTDDTGNIARIIPNCQTQEYIQYPLLALFSNNYSKYCKRRRSFDSQFFRLLGLLFFLRVSIYQYKLDCNKLTRGPSESMHSDNTALLACMKYSWKLNGWILFKHPCFSRSLFGIFQAFDCKISRHLPRGPAFLLGSLLLG